MLENRRWLLVRRPTGTISDADFQWTTAPVPEIADGEILVRVLWLSCDPAQRMWFSRDTYIPAVPIGDVVRSSGVGRVIASKNPRFAIGDLVSGLVGWQDYAVLSPGGIFTPSKLPADADIPVAMSVLGVTGLTAYFGLLEVGRPKEGDTLVVSGAAGATGAVVGQIGKIKGCRVIGIAGGREKCAYLEEKARFDHAIDYKSEDVAARLRALAPNGIDIFFDNVGGELLDVALEQLAMRGRVVVCGAVAQYNDTISPPGPKNYLNLIVRRGRMEGFVVTDFMGSASTARSELRDWLAAGKIVNQVDAQEGLENAPKTLRRLFSGQNHGKQLLRVAES